MVFFLFLPLLLSFKLCKAIFKCCCKKKPASKEDTETKDEDKDEDEIQGPEVAIFKDRDILEDGSLPCPSSQVSSKQNVTGVKRSHSNSSRRSLIIKKSKHGSEDEGIMTERDRDILEDGSPPCPSSQVSSEQNVTGVKRSYSNSSRSSLVIKKSKHESEEEGIMTENRRTSTSRQISSGRMEDKTPSQDCREASMQKNEPSVIIKD